MSNSKDASQYYPLHTKRHMRSTPFNKMTFSMEHPMYWNYKYHMPIEFVAAFDTEQEFVDHMFIWMIYSNFGVLLSVEELSVTA